MQHYLLTANSKGWQKCCNWATFRPNLAHGPWKPTRPGVAADYSAKHVQSLNIRGQLLLIPAETYIWAKKWSCFTNHDWCQTTTVHRKEPSRHIILHRLSWCNRSQLSHVLITCQCPYTCDMLLYSQLHHSYLSIVLGSSLACLFPRKCYTTHIPKKTRWSVCDKLIWTFSNYLNLTEKLLNNEARQTKREARETPPFSIQ